MSYYDFFGATSSATLSNVVEIDSVAAEAAMTADLAEFDREDAKASTALTSLEALDALIEINLRCGAPSTPAEKMLTQLGALVTFGGEVPFEEITEGYSIESFAGEEHGYALESLKRRAQGIWDWIKAQVVKIWKIIERFFYNLFGAIPNMRKKAEALRKRAADANGKTKENNKFEVDANTVNALADADGKARGQASAIIKDLEDGSSLIEAAEKHFYNRLEKLAKAIDDGINGADPEDSAYLKTINDGVEGSEAYATLTGTKLFNYATLKSLGQSDKRFSGRTAFKLGLFSNKTLYQSVLASKSQTEGDDASELRRSQVIRGLKVEVRETDPKAKKLQSQSLDVWDLTDCEKLADAVDKFCDAAESVQRGAEKGSIKKAQTKLEKSGDKFGKALETARKRTGDDSLSADQISTARSALNYVKFFGDVVAKPLPQIISLYMTGFNAAMSLANRSISQYK